MIQTNNNQMLLEAKKAKFKPNIFLQIIIFIGVMLVISIISGILLGIPSALWMISQPGYMDAAMSGDFQTMLNYSAQSPEWLLIAQLF